MEKERSEPEADAIAAKLIPDRTWYVPWEDLEKRYDEIG